MSNWLKSGRVIVRISLWLVYKSRQVAGCKCSQCVGGGDFGS